MAKIIATIILVIGVLLFIVVNYSAVESNYRCDGSWADSTNTFGPTIFLRLAEYRWWVNLWGDSDGAIWIEIPNEWIDYFGDIEDLGTQLQIFDFDGDIRGSFSKISNTVAIMTAYGFFDGTCTLRN